MYFNTTLFPQNYSKTSHITLGINQVIASPTKMQLVFHLNLTT